MAITLTPAHYIQLRVLHYALSRAQADIDAAEQAYHAFLATLDAAYADFTPTKEYTANDDCLTLTEQ